MTQPPYAPGQQQYPQAQQYTPPPAAPKKSNTWKWLLGIAVGLVVLCGGVLGACAVLAGGVADDVLGEKTIVFEVSGPPAADVTYGVGADQSQENGVALPWRKEVTSDDALLVTALVAQSKGSGEITCKITIDGVLVKEQKSVGEFAVVTCSNG